MKISLEYKKKFKYKKKVNSNLQENDTECSLGGNEINLIEREANF